jgi:hypothetical protein
MARERRSPYLPGTRSGLWLFVERAAVAPNPDHGPGPGAGAEAEPGEGDTGAVLALISRLPLED